MFFACALHVAVLLILWYRARDASASKLAARLSDCIDLRRGDLRYAPCGGYSRIEGHTGVERHAREDSCAVLRF